jgi:hypothetical protein
LRCRMRQHATLPLAFRLALDLGMNLAPVDVAHAHGDGARRPVNVADKLNRPNSVPSVGEQFPDDAGRAVWEFDSELHGPSRAGDDAGRLCGPRLHRLSPGKSEPRRARRLTDAFIETTSNAKRLHSALGNKPPAEFEADLRSIANRQPQENVSPVTELNVSHLRGALHLLGRQNSQLGRQNSRLGRNNSRLCRIEFPVCCLFCQLPCSHGASGAPSFRCKEGVRCGVSHSIRLAIAGGPRVHFCGRPGLH